MCDAEPTTRDATPPDAEALAALFHAYHIEAVGQPPALTAAIIRRDGFGHRFHAIVAAAPKAPLIGFALWQAAYEPDRATSGGYLNDLYVAPPWRRRGIARRLMRAIARAVQADGGGFLSWSTQRDNTGARRLYNCIGESGEDIVPYVSRGRQFASLAEVTGSWSEG